MHDSLYARLLALPVGAALVLPLGVSHQSAEQAIKAVIAQDSKRRYAIGDHIVRPWQAELVRHVRIKRVPDKT